MLLSSPLQIQEMVNLPSQYHQQGEEKGEAFINSAIGSLLCCLTQGSSKFTVVVAVLVGFQIDTLTFLQLSL